MIGITAPAKINLFLRIYGKNTSGYHLIDSLIAFTTFGDHLTIEPAPKDEFVLIGDFASAIKTHPKDNLVLRALDAFRQSGGVIDPVKIVLDKKIPVGAGLGGGSSNAATLLLALNKQSKKPLSQDTIYDIGLRLGADVPVCLSRSCQRIANIGEVLTPHDLPTVNAVLLVNPCIPLSTSEVFANFSSSNAKYGSRFSGSLSLLDAADLVKIGNDLTETAATLVPQINHCLGELLAATGVIAAAMSGSGSSCFAFFDNSENALLTAQRMRNEGYWAEVTSIYQSKNKLDTFVSE